jgi:hypothetical protein
LENPPSVHARESGLSGPLLSREGGLENPPSVLERLQAEVKSICAIPQVLAFAQHVRSPNGVAR